MERNRVKRMLREAFWASAEELRDGHDFVIVARPRRPSWPVTEGSGRSSRRWARFSPSRGCQLRASRRHDRPPLGCWSRRSACTSASSPRDSLAVQIPSLLLGLRHPGDQAVRRAPRSGARRLAGTSLQPMEPRRRGLRGGSDAVPGEAEPLSPCTHSERPPAPDRCVPVGARVLARPDRRLRWQLGRVDHPADLHGAAGDPAAHVQGREVDAAPSAAPAGDQEDPGALQGRQAAHQPGGHGLLPAGEGQPAGSCLPLLLQIPFFISLF